MILYAYTPDFGHYGKTASLARRGRGLVLMESVAGLKVYASAGLGPGRYDFLSVQFQFLHRLLVRVRCSTSACRRSVSSLVEDRTRGLDC